eukprot:2774782-Pleurochrysis_carterae.AAC.6
MAARRGSGRAMEATPCSQGLVHVFNGYRSCALDPQPCATKVLESENILMAECINQCGPLCKAVSLFESRECWVYSALRGDPIGDERSIYCARAQPPPPAPPPPPPPPPSPIVQLANLQTQMAADQQLALLQLQ